MQGRENTSGDLMALRFVHLRCLVCGHIANPACPGSMQRLLDPPGSAYRSETGGLMEALRKLTVDQSEYILKISQCVRLTQLPFSPGISCFLLCAAQSVSHRSRKAVERY